MTDALAVIDAATAEWDRMSPRERDAAVAESVLGLRYCIEDYPWPRSSDGICKRRVWRDAEGHGVYIGDSDLPQFTAYPAQDYRVLEHVRANWPREKRTDFWQWCELIAFKRNADPNIGRAWLACNILENYRPGDYSHAAFMAARESAPPSP